MKALLLACSSWIPLAAHAEEPASARPAVSLETLKQQSPVQRWERVKSQAAPVDAPVPSKAATPRPGVVLPLPEDDIAIVPSELKLAPALPSATEEPRWIVPNRPVPEPIADPTLSVAETVKETIPEQGSATPKPVPMVARSVEPARTVGAVAIAVQETPAETAVNRPSAPQRLRAIQEISPYYDTSVDDDIRKFAVNEASKYSVSFGSQPFAPRAFPDTMYAWEPSNFYHYPLYFEDAVLERYGHAYHPVVQPVVSVAKFSTQLVLLPYQMTLDPIDRPMYALGWYRPGDCAPKLRYQPPLNGKAAAVEAGVVTGLFFLIP